MAKKTSSAIIRDVILGGQDGLVNVLGIVLAVATATKSIYVIIISGLAATFAESISMAAVAYTSAKAGKEYYKKEEKRLKKLPLSDKRKEVRSALHRAGLEGSFLNRAIKHVLSSKKRLHRSLTLERHAVEFMHPVRDSVVVGFAAIVGSLVPLIPFFRPFFVSMNLAIILTLAFSAVVLFITGALKARYTEVNPWKSGLEMALVGITAAVAGYLIGLALGTMPVA